MKRALLVTPILPWDASFGAAQRTSLLYEAAQKKMPVDVLQVEGASKFAVCEGERPGLLAHLRYQAVGFRGFSLAPDRRLVEWAAKHIDWKQYSLVLGRYPAPLLKLGVPRGLPIIVDADDAVRRTNAKGLRGMASNIKSRLRSFLLQRALRDIDYVFFTSAAERRLYTSLRGGLLPNVPYYVRPDPIPPSDHDTKIVLFVGALWYEPNKNGIEWFLQQCWPALKQRLPNLGLRLIGACPPAQRALWERHPDVEAPGFVTDLQAEYDRALFAIAPIWEGAGTNIKVLEAYAYGRACLTTRSTFGAFSDSFRDGVSIAVADTALEMVERCVALCESTSSRQEMAAAGRVVLQAHFSRRRFEDIVGETIEKVLAT